MSRLEEKLSDQFFDWERHGRGWQVWDTPVAPEPPFRPFHSHYVLPEAVPDDGRRPTFLSSLVSRLSRGLANPSEPKDIPPEEEEEPPEPEVFERESSLVELQTSLPLSLNIARESVEQLFLSLGECREPLSFEIIGSHDSILAQFAASELDAPRLQQQLEAHFADGVFVPQTGVLEEKWQENDNDETLLVQFGLAREFMFPIASGKGFGLDPYIGITGALSRLQAGELGIFQVIFERVRHPWSENILRSVTDNSGGDFFVNAPELAKEARNKISRPLYAAVVRIAVKTENYDRTLEIARGLAGALAVFSNPQSNAFIPLENKAYPLAAHEEDLLRRQSRRSGMILNSDELISLVHLPSSSVRSPKLKREADKSKAAPAIALNPSGLLLGDNLHAGKTKRVILNPEQRVRHTYVIGASGTGKSTFLFNLIQQDIESGQGLAVLDPHGDLIEKILGCIPQKRIQDVVLVDPSDEAFSVGFNILSAHSDLEKNLLASDLVSVFQRLSTSWGDQMNSVLGNAIRAFLESSQGGTLSDLRRFLIEPSFRNEFLKTVTDPDVVYYWQKGFPLLSGNKSVGPVLTRLETFLSPKPIRYMVSQKENRLDFADIMNSGKIFLAKLSQGKMGKENSYLLGSLLVAKFHQTAMSRQNLAEAQRRNFWLYMDEFHNFITPSMAEILTGARKYRVGLILAHQELRQLQRDSEVASAVLSNPYTRVCFRVGDQDAKALENGFSFFQAKDLQNLGTGEALCRMERSDFDFNLRIPLSSEAAEADTTQRREEVIAASRARYAVSRSEIEAALRQERPAEEATGQSVPKEKATRSEEKKSSPLTEMVVPAAPVELPAAPPALPQREAATVSEKKSSILPAVLGRGGEQHQAIQQRLKGEAERLGFRATIEKEILQGSVDLALEKAGQVIACEISVTTTIDHEFGNVTKCLRAGFPFVAVISGKPERLKQIAEAVKTALSSDEASRVGYYTPEEFITHLQKLATIAPVRLTPTPAESQRRGYRIKRSNTALTHEEQSQREAAAIQLIAETMRNKPK